MQVVGRLSQEQIVFGLALLLCLGFAVALPGFLTAENVLNLVRSVSILGILGVVICSVLAPFAWKIGKQAVTEIDASGGQMGGRGQAQAGYILGVVGTILLVLGVLFFLVAIPLGFLANSSGSDLVGVLQD